MDLSKGKNLMDKAETQHEKSQRITRKLVVNCISGTLSRIYRTFSDLSEAFCCICCPRKRTTPHALTFNSRSLVATERIVPILTNIMEALADPDIHIIGIHSSSNAANETLVETIRRRVHRDMALDKVLIAKVTKKPDVKRIQEQIAGQLGFNFNENSKSKRAGELLDRIKNEQKILIILCDLCERLDLESVGIPFGASHRGCNILLTSTSEEVLSSHMNTQKIFMV